MSKKLFNLILLGAAGSGKGTQGQLLAEKLNLKIIETGELVRVKAKEKSKQGYLFKLMHAAGMHFSDQQIFDLIEAAVKKVKRGKNILFDGYPRTAGQAWDLERLIHKYCPHSTFAVWLKLSDREAIKRLRLRAICPKCGAIYTSRTIKICLKCGAKLEVRDYDTNIKAIKERLQWFHDHVLPAIEFYKQRKILITINGERPIEKVFADMLKQLEKRLPQLKR